MALTGNGDRKIQLLAVYKILQKTTKEHPMTTAKINMELRDYNVKITRKTLSDDLICIEIIDPDFRKKIKGKNTGYYWLERE